MPLNLFAPPSTDWLTESRNRMSATAGGFNRAVDATRSDAFRAARGAAGPAYGAAAARDAAAAVAPEVARLRAAQANAMDATRAGIRADQTAESLRRGDFMNNLVGGLAGLAGTVMAPLISGLGGGGSPLGGGGGGLGANITTSASGGRWTGSTGGGPAIPTNTGPTVTGGAPTSEWGRDLVRGVPGGVGSAAEERVRPVVDAPMRVIPPSGPAPGSPAPAPAEFHRGDFAGNRAGPTLASGESATPWWRAGPVRYTGLGGARLEDGFGNWIPPTRVHIDPTHTMYAPPGSPEYDAWYRSLRGESPEYMTGDWSPPTPAAAQFDEFGRRRAGLGSVLGGAAPIASMMNPFAGLAMNAASGFFR